MSEKMANVQSTDQAPSEPSVEVQEGENVQSTENVEQATDQSSESDTHDTPIEEGNDGVDKPMPAGETDREKSAIRKMHEATQQAAQYKKDADALQQLLHHPEFNEFLQWQKQKQSPASQQNTDIPQVDLTEDELLAAQTDPSKFNGLLNSRLQAMLNPIAQQAMQKIGALERDLALSKHEREIDAFATKHPDFWNIDQRIMKAAIADTRGQGLDAAYKVAKQLEKQYLDKAQTSIQKKVTEKKQASSASPSRSVERKIIYVESDSEANRIAFENAQLDKRVDVRVKRK